MKLSLNVISAPTEAEVSTKAIKTVEHLKDVSRSNSKKIIFVDAGAPVVGMYGTNLSLGVQILQDISTKEGYKYSSYQLNKSSEGQIIDSLRAGDILALSSTSSGHISAIKLANKVKQRFGDKVLIIKGGKVHEGHAAENLQKDESYPIDFSFTGEADISFRNFLRLVKQASDLEPTDVLRTLDSNPIAYKGRISSIGNPKVLPQEQVLPELNHLELNEPYSIFPNNDDGLMLRIMTQRGCNEPCTFCALDKDVTRLTAKHSVDYIGNIVKQAHEQGLKIRYIFIENGNFILDPKLDRNVKDETPHSDSVSWVNEFATHMEELNKEFADKYGFNIIFGIQTTIKSIEEGVINKLHKAGLRGAYIGVESVDRRILQHMSATSKTGAGNKYSEAITILNNHGINASCATMVEPGCEEAAIKTVEKLTRESSPHEIFIEYRAVYPGTPDEKRVAWKEENNAITSIDSSEVVTRYNKGIFNGGSIPNPEDRTKVIVKTNLTDGKLIIADPDEVKRLSHMFYTKLRELTSLQGYKTIVDGHYIKQSSDL